MSGLSVLTSERRSWTRIDPSGDGFVFSPTEVRTLAKSFSVFHAGEKLALSARFPYATAILESPTSTLTRLEYQVRCGRLKIEIRNLTPAELRYRINVQRRRISGELSREKFAQKKTLVFEKGRPPVMLDRTKYAYPFTPPPFDFIDVNHPPRRIPSQINGVRILDPFTANAAMCSFAYWTTKEAETPEQRVQLLFKAITRRLRVRYRHASRPLHTTIEVFRGVAITRRGYRQRLANCTEYSFLFVSLLGTLGIEAFPVYRKNSRNEAAHMLTAVLLAGGIHYYDLICRSHTTHPPSRSYILSPSIARAYFHYWRGNAFRDTEHYAEALAELAVVYEMSPTKRVQKEIQELIREQKRMVA